ncbi:MAG: ABC transporter permease [Treponema sp.]|nr:ABC transporter permease [Treponema sp.]
MTFKSSLMFAKSLIFPRAEKKSSARRSLWGALICIGLSVVPLVVVLSVSNGMIQGMTDRIIGLSSNNIQAYVSPKLKDTQTPDSYRAYAQQFLDVDGVLEVYPEIGVTALAAGKKMRTGAQIRAVDKDIFSKNKAFRELFTLIEGNYDDYEYQDAEETSSSLRMAVIGQKMAEMLDIHAGDTFRVITIKTNNGKQSPKLTSFTVAAIVSSGYQELDALWIFVPLETVYQFVSLDNASYTIMINTPDAYSADLVRIQRELKAQFGKYMNFYRWDQVHEAEFENFSSTKVMLVFIMLLIVLVASINISSAIVMLVMERRKEIAILKSIGATPSGITFSFIITGMTCGLGGLIIGLPFGLLAAVNANQIVTGIEKIINFFARVGYLLKGVPADEINAIKLMDPAYYLQTIPVNLPLSQLLLISVATVLLALLVSIIPSVKAGKEKPLDIIRKA